MADKKNDKFLSLYPEDFEGKVWEQVCDVVEKDWETTKELRIYFGDNDVVSINEDEEEDK